MSTAMVFLSNFPNTDQNVATGGGCTAWRVPLEGGWYALVTDGDANAPSLDDRKVFVSIYDESHGSVDFEDPDLVDWRTAIDLLHEWNRPDFR